MSDIGFLRASPAHIPSERRMYAAAWGFYAIVLVAAVALVRPQPVRMNAGGTPQVGIAAFNAGPVGTTGMTQPRPKAPTQAFKKPILHATAASPEEMSSAHQGSGAAGAQSIGSGAGSGPVNLGTGAGMTLLRKVTPTYPRMMEQARMTGTVVLEAIIHRDGTIGDVTLKSSTNAAFAQAAIEAVKNWRYSPIPYEGIVTVTVNFSLTH